jgi:hypothetical protein
VKWKLVDGLIDAGIKGWNPEPFAQALGKLGVALPHARFEENATPTESRQVV